MTNEIITIASSTVEKKNLLGENLVDRFIRFAGVAEKSAMTYKIAFRQLAKYFAANNITEPARNDLENWRDGLIADKKSPATVQLYLTSAKIFFRWLAQENLYPNIADHLKSRVKINHAHKKRRLNFRAGGQSN